jgi:5-methyltetrahydrofolate--homocysteine methyltransferase
VEKGKTEDVKKMVDDFVKEGKSAKEILDEGLLAAMNIIGEKFKNNQIFIPHVLIGARAFNAGVEILKPLLASDNVKALGQMVIGTVKGDLHDIGKNLVKIMVQGAGIEVHDLGTDVSAQKFVDFLKEHPDVQLVGLSALLTTTMPSIKATIDAVKEAGLSDKCKVVIGGAPVTQKYADEVGASGYAADAGSAAQLCKELIQSAA